jgi:hypothetical protein
MLGLPKKYYEAHAQCADVKASVEDDRLETEVRSETIGMDATGCHEALRGPSTRKVPVLVRYYVSFFKTFAAQLQLRNLHWLVWVQSVGDMHSCDPQVLYCLCRGDAAPNFLNTLAFG